MMHYAHHSGDASATLPMDRGAAAACAAAAENRWETFAGWLCIVLVSRFVSEAVNTFLWDRANYVWSACALAAFALLLWPMLLKFAHGEGNIFAGYFPIFAYLVVLLARTRLDNVYALKCALSEVVLWTCFLFTVEVCSRSGQGAAMVRTWLLRVVKAIVLLGVAQLLVSCAGRRHVESGGHHGGAAGSGRVRTPERLLGGDPAVRLLLPQAALLVVVCLDGGRLPGYGHSLAVVCGSVFRVADPTVGLEPPDHLAAPGRHLRDRGGRLFPAGAQTSASGITARRRARICPRCNGASRLWQQFLEDERDPAFWLGHGVGTADNVSTELSGEATLPHNDYLRTYYDLGLVGLLATALLVAFMIRLLVRSATVQSDFILPAYLLIVCFRFTDNFMYVTVPLWIYMFLGSFAARPHAREDT